MKIYYKTFTKYNSASTRNINNRYLKNTSIIKTGGRNYPKLASYEKNYKQFNEGLDNVLYRELSKKKNRGVLDVSSIGNKDVLTDSDSEVLYEKSKYEGSNKKGKCTKLIIEKVESKVPQINEEYYKFTNKKKIYPYNNKIYNSNNRFMINKKLKGSPIDRNYSNRFYKNKIYESQDSENLVKLNKKQRGNELIIEPYNICYTNYKSNNYSVNRVTTDDSSKSKNNYNKEKKRDSFNNNYIGNMIVVNKSPYLKNSTENSAEKKSSSFNYAIYQPKKINFFEENDYGNINDEIYIQKRTMGLKRNLAPKNNPQKPLSRYGNYKNLTQKPKLTQEINLNYNPTFSKSYLQNRFNDKLIKNVTKIQSFWRGAFTRELMTFFWNLNILRDNLVFIFKSHLRDYFHYFLNNIKYYQKPKKISVALNNRNSNLKLRQKFLIDKPKNNKINNIKKESNNNNNNFHISTLDKANDEKYNKLLENYNSLLDKYNKLKEEKDNKSKMKSFDKLDINSNNFGIIYKKSKINIIKKEKNKKFEVIEPGKKEEFNIIQKELKRKKSNTTQVKSIEKVSEIVFLKSINKKNDRNNNISYEDYLNHFKSNIFIINDNQLYIKHTLDKNSKNKRSIKEDAITPKIFENISINKNNNEVTILKAKKPELIQENQKNLNTEIKGIENDKLKIFKDCIVNEHKNNINIIQVNEQDKPKKDIILNIVSEEIKFDIIENNKSNKEKKTKRKSKNKNKNKEKEKIESDKNKELVIEKKEDILLVERNIPRKFDDMVMIDNNNTLLIKNSKKKKQDEITEITEELNKIEPNTHYELFFKGIIMDLSQKLDNIQKEKENKINNKKNSDNDEENKKKVYNEKNEIEKGEGLEINPMEMKRTKNNINNIFISYENKIGVLNSKNDIFTEKAKRNMMKIILPIRLKSTLREYVRKNIYPLLISNLKKIALSISSIKSDDNEKESASKKSINKSKKK